MRTNLTTLMPVLVAIAACSDGDAAPTAASGADAGMAGHNMHQMSMGLAISATPTPFTFRAPLEPFRIHQLPDFLMHTTARKDVVFQQNVFQPGAGPWHTHPGPSIVYVIDGQIKLERHNKHEGCTATPVHGPGNIYFELAEEVHRAVVLSATPAVVLVTRFNIPVGAPITTMAADPGC